MDLLSVIRRWHFRQHVPIREIKRRTGLSRNTIRKYLRADMVEPKFKVPVRPGKLAPFADKLTGWLRQEAGKSRKQKRTAKQMHTDLVVLGYDGSYGRVAAFVRRWTIERSRSWSSRSSSNGSPRSRRGRPGETRRCRCARCRTWRKSCDASARPPRRSRSTASAWRCRCTARVMCESASWPPRAGAR